MALRDITALIITYNEEANIERTISKLGGFRRVIVLDSGSTDKTCEIASALANATVVTRQFDTFAEQCNFGLRHALVETEWVLSLDADYVLSDELVSELTSLMLSDRIGGFRAKFRYCVFGKVIRCGVYPPVTILFRKGGAKFVNDGHGHRVVVDGSVQDLAGCVYHDDRKSLRRWLDSQRGYARQEADKLENARENEIDWRDRVRLWIGIAAPLMFVYVLVVRGGILDGRRGVYYAFQRAYAELLLSLELLDRRLRRMSGH